jgi:hypothetical protein
MRSHQTAPHRSGATSASAEEGVEITIECLKEAVHVKDIIDTRRLVGLHQQRSIEGIDLGAVAVDDRGDEGLRAAM